MNEFEGTTLDVADLYDADQVRLDRKLRELGARFARRPNTPEWINECAKQAEEEMAELGFVVKVITTEALFGVGPLTIEIVSRVPDHVDNKYGHDHERKRMEVQMQRERGDVGFLGRSDGKTV